MKNKITENRLKNLLSFIDIPSKNLRFKFNDHGKLIKSKIDYNKFFDNILDLTYFNENKLTEIQSKFYNEIKFPNYDQYDNFSSLLDKANRSKFAKKLDEQLPMMSKILEAGCGTGQMSLFLSRYNRTVYGIDVSKGSLSLGENFRKKNNIENVYFARMDILNSFLKKNYFDVVISNGVLHHTSNPKQGLYNLAETLKPKGILIIGLYHKYGRIYTNIKQFLAPFLKQNIKYFDPILYRMESKDKQNAWFKDQYFNPHESSHTLMEVLDWFNEIGLEFVNSIPFTSNNDLSLFESKPSPKKIDLFFKELIYSFSSLGVQESDFFTIIGRKK